MPDGVALGPDSGVQPRWSGLDGAMAELSMRQHGVVTRAQLLELGLGRRAIGHRLERGRLHPIHRGVYAVGHPELSRAARWTAAVLAGGPGAVLSHRCAGALWGIRSDSRSRIEVTTPRGQHARPGIQFHRSWLPPDEVTVRDGIPVTTVPRTLFDLAAVVDQRQLERAVNEAEVLRLWDELNLDDLLRRYKRRPGTRNVRAVLQARRAGASFTRSDLEELFLRFADRARLPRPATNVPVEGFEVDCVWRAQRVVVEVDGWATHGTRAAFERDREKSRVLQAAGWRCVPVTFLQLRDTPHEVERDVRRMLDAAAAFGGATVSP